MVVPRGDNMMKHSALVEINCNSPRLRAVVKYHVSNTQTHGDTCTQFQLSRLFNNTCDMDMKRHAGSSVLLHSNLPVSQASCCNCTVQNNSLCVPL